MKKLLGWSGGGITASGSLTPRQAVVVAAALVTGTGAAVLAVAGVSRAAAALTALLLAMLLVAVVQLRRRVAAEVGALRTDIAGLAERLSNTQRQVVAAVEDERLADVRRHPPRSQP